MVCIQNNLTLQMTSTMCIHMPLLFLTQKILLSMSPFTSTALFSKQPATVVLVYLEMVEDIYLPYVHRQQGTCGSLTSSQLVYNYLKSVTPNHVNHWIHIRAQRDSQESMEPRLHHGQMFCNQGQWLNTRFGCILTHNIPLFAS